jgi:putative FmdB family regulatory protein
MRIGIFIVPVYEYKCVDNELHEILSVTRSISEDDPGYKCAECESNMARHFSSFGIQFKGNGFYKTDNPK